MCSSEINAQGELRRQPANPGSPGKLVIKMDSMWRVTPNDVWLKLSFQMTPNHCIFIFVSMLLIDYVYVYVLKCQHLHKCVSSRSAHFSIWNTNSWKGIHSAEVEQCRQNAEKESKTPWSQQL